MYRKEGEYNKEWNNIWKDEKILQRITATKV